MKQYVVFFKDGYQMSVFCDSFEYKNASLSFRLSGAQIVVIDCQIVKCVRCNGAEMWKSGV